MRACGRLYSGLDTRLERKFEKKKLQCLARGVTCLTKEMESWRRREPLSGGLLVGKSEDETTGAQVLL